MSSDLISRPNPDAGGAPATPRGDESAVATDAHVDLERTVLPTLVSARLALALIAVFAALLAVVPLAQITLEASGRQSAQLGDLFRQAPTRANLHKYEEAIARNSVFKQAVQPQVQLALSGLAGWGNSNVYIGRDGVLFYRPGINFVTGRGICDTGRIRARRKKLVDAGEPSAEPDPRPAILAFNAACNAAGVHLVVLPVPDKVMVMPEKAGIEIATPEGGNRALIANCDYTLFLSEMREAGVDVFDLVPRALEPSETPRFLEQDTHWTPAWMTEAARLVAARVRKSTVLPPADGVLFRSESIRVNRVGDLVDMLGLPSNQTLFAPRDAVVERTLDARTGTVWKPDPSADVLFLGDSFANIYTAPEMGWGEAAGFAPTLARFLNRPVDAIALNGGGASKTRAELARRPDGLAGKRVVIWEFAVRELTDASWDVIPLGTNQDAQPEAPAGAGLVVDATLEVTSKVPDPFSVPYPDCLTYTMVRVDRVVQGAYDKPRMLAVMWAMKNNVWLPAAKYAPGRRMRLRVIPMDQADESVRTGQRVDDTQDYAHKPYFVAEERGL